MKYRAISEKADNVIIFNRFKHVCKHMLVIRQKEIFWGTFFKLNFNKTCSIKTERNILKLLRLNVFEQFRLICLFGFWIIL